MIVDNNTYEVQDANESWSLTSPAPQTLRFELRPQDHWAEDYSTSIQRSEIAGNTHYASRTPLEVSYNFTVEPGQANTASWLLVGQFHNYPDDGSSPPFAIEMHGENMRIVARSSNNSYMDLYDDPNPIQRGHSYAMKIDVNFDNSGNGYLHVWRDGVEIVNYQGPIGYGQQVYWKEGIYRTDAPQTMAVDFQNLHITDNAIGSPDVVPPGATDDNYATAVATKLIVGASGVLTDDTNVDGNALFAVLVSKPIDGQVRLHADGSFIYTPHKHFSGLDSFSYKASDGWSLSDAATVTIQVGDNTAPVATNDSYVANQNTKLIVSGLDGLLANDTDINGDALSAKLVAMPSHGKVSVSKDGSLVYTPSKNFVGVDSFAYKASDGWSNSNVATVSITVGQNGAALASKIDLFNDQILPPLPSKTVSSATHSQSDHFVAFFEANDHGFLGWASTQSVGHHVAFAVEDSSHMQVLHEAHLLLM